MGGAGAGIRLGRLILRILAEWFLLIVIGVLIYVLYWTVIQYLPTNWGNLLRTYEPVARSLIIITIGAILVWDTGKRVSEVISVHDRVLGSMLKFILNLVIIVAVLVALAVTFVKFGLSIAAFTGTATGLIIGLAVQQTFQNVIAGIVIVITSRYKPGDRVTIVNWRYGVIRAMYPTEGMPNGFTGTIRSISLMFTELISDNGQVITIPNYVMLDSLIIHRERAPFKRVRARLDVPSTVDPWAFEERLKEAIRDGSIKEVKVRVSETWQSTSMYQVVIEALADGNLDGELVKDKILRAAIKVRNELSGGNKN
ncbi:mechanosensitive ion channel family protein [Vulcanisaeta thermophila]|uniref:mechanosensitive ion channel family protein n=1 Tax=Vulcanisaeta thermophila TaxID=867917 RepID=UPI000852F717|nr:mechanosensitive ion channel family protein [Vulcanisaeta thermophila]